MGTLSKRPLRDFGIEIKQKLDDVRHNVGGRLDDFGARARAEASRDSEALAMAIEKMTKAVPTSTWLALAGVSLGSSLLLKARGRNHLSLTVGQWVPTFLILGLYHRVLTGSQRAPR